MSAAGGCGRRARPRRTGRAAWVARAGDGLSEETVRREEYLARKEAESKTEKGALRCLKRHLARRFYLLLAEPPADQPQTVEPESIPERERPAIPERPRPEREVEQITAAPSPMVCVT
jgi:hypothetical protein